jgi:serine acetyltransferase
VPANATAIGVPARIRLGHSPDEVNKLVQINNISTPTEF